MLKAVAIIAITLVAVASAAAVTRSPTPSLACPTCGAGFHLRG